MQKVSSGVIITYTRVHQSRVYAVHARLAPLLASVPRANPLDKRWKISETLKRTSGILDTCSRIV